MSDVLATSVVVAGDDHHRRTVRAALAGHPDLRVVAEAGDAGGAVMAAAQTVPDVVVLHVDLGPDLARAAHRIEHDLPGTAVVIVGPCPPELALDTGAVAVIADDAPELADAVWGASRGEARLDAALAALLLTDGPTGAELSPTEAEVLRRLAGHDAVERIAADYDVPARLVRVHARAAVDRARVARHG
ncbi:MAG TPA: hypothetical protein VK866_09120 [Acidimicrobiales bacterium]|nr:hypothetical protein [Acidimicrobiales bacterium]